MKSLVFTVLFATLLLTACSDDAQVNAPVGTPDAPMSFAGNLGNLDLSMEQSALIDEMYFMDEDLSLLLDAPRLLTFDSMIDGRLDRKASVDIAAIIYYQLIVKANPDMSEELLAQLREMIAASNKLRERILNSDKSREEKMRLLKAEHEKLMAAMMRLIGEEAVANVQRLQEQLKQEREERRDEWQSLRIDRLVDRMTSVLGLSEEEAASVKEILMLQYKEIARLREQYKDNPEGFREALAALHARIDARMSELLGNRWERWKELQRRQITPGDRQPNIDMHLKQLTELLNLTERQQAAVKEILIEQQRLIKQLMEKYEGDRAGLAQALRQLQERINAKIASLLNDRQLEIWKKHLAGMNDRNGTGTGRRG
ncbi:hypothetical protein KQI65_17090 [bacterium]|nr:hypothetical protein [bacterium]